jgi:hypothetical protein
MSLEKPDVQESIRQIHDIVKQTFPYAQQVDICVTPGKISLNEKSCYMSK